MAGLDGVNVDRTPFDVDLGHAVRLVFDPALISLPIRHVTGQPFYYLQYRLCLGIWFGA